MKKFLFPAEIKSATSHSPDGCSNQLNVDLISAGGGNFFTCIRLCLYIKNSIPLMTSRIADCACCEHNIVYRGVGGQHNTKIVSPFFKYYDPNDLYV